MGFFVANHNNDTTETLQFPLPDTSRYFSTRIFECT